MTARKAMMGPSLVQSSARSVFQINVNFLFSTLMGWLAWGTWPLGSSAIGWGLVSIMFGLVSLSMVIKALTLMVKLYQRDRTIALYVQQGTRPKVSELASEDALKNAGMR